MDRVERAWELRKKGYNCSQAVACVFCEEAGADEATIFRLTEGLGGGMGAQQGVCGAISGAVAAIGLFTSTANLEKPDSKMDTYQLTKQVLARFEEKNQSSVCKDLKGVETGTVLRSCEGCIEDGIRLVEELLAEKLLAERQ